MSETMAVLVVDGVPNGIFQTAAKAKSWAKQHDRVDEDDARVWYPIPVREEGAELNDGLF